MAKDVWDMTDEELESAFYEAKSEDYSEDEVSSETNETEEQSEDSFNSDTDGTAIPDSTPEDEETIAQNSSEHTSEDVDNNKELEEDPEETVAADEARPTDSEDVTTTKEASTAITHSIKANGKNYEFTEDEMLKQFPLAFQQAMDYTKKAQRLKPFDKIISALESEGLGESDVNLMIDAFKGSKEALASVIQRAGVDPFEVADVETGNKPYVPNSYGESDSEQAIKSIVNRIGQEPEYAKTKSIISSDWDDASWKEIQNRPDTIELLHTDVKAGVYDKVQPIADVLKMNHVGTPKSDLDFYIDASIVYFQKLTKQAEAQKIQEQNNAHTQNVASIKEEQARNTAVKQNAPKRKAAGSPKKISNSAATAIDYLNASEEEFEKWRKGLDDNY